MEMSSIQEPKRSLKSKPKPKLKPQKQNGTITDYDREITAMFNYITSSMHRSVYRTVFSKNELEKLKEIKRSDVKKRRFKKWYNMSYTKTKGKKIKASSNSDIIDSINKSIICSSLCLGSTSFMSSHSIINDDLNNANSTETISQSEKGLLAFYNKFKDVFVLRVYKSPPEVFRKSAWFTCSNVPLNRNGVHYYNILSHQLNYKTKTQINKDILRTMEEQEINLPELQEPLFRVLKAIALLDKELSYCQGMNFIIGFILILMQGNEVDAFYFSIALFSQTYSDKFGIRGFYLEDFPLLDLYMFIFEYHFKKRMSKLYSKLKTFEIPAHCWVGKWFQTLFVNAFPEAIVIKIWDGILAFGIQFIISIALSIINHFESGLLALDDIVEIADFFRTLSKQSSNSKELKFDIEDIMKKAKSKYYLSDDDIKNMITIYFENNQKDSSSDVDNEKKEDAEQKMTRVMNCINSRVEYDIENFESNQTLFETTNKEALYDTINNKENCNCNNNDSTPIALIGNDYCYRESNKRVDTIYDGDINEFYLNTIESNGKKFEKPIPTKHLFKNPFISEFII